MDRSAMLREWCDGGRENAREIADMLGVPIDIYEGDPLTLIPALQAYVERLPFGEFEQSDWATIHMDLTSYLADVLIRRYGAAWKIEDDSTSPVGYRYVIEAKGLDGIARRVDPTDVVALEFHEQPVTIIRMLANAEYTLRLTPVVE